MKLYLICSLLVLTFIVSEVNAQTIKKIEASPLKLTIYHAPETDASMNLTSVKYTKQYLKTYEQELKK